jgi:hypothetical protein
VKFVERLSQSGLLEYACGITTTLPDDLVQADGNAGIHQTQMPYCRWLALHREAYLRLNKPLQGKQDPPSGLVTHDLEPEVLSRSLV